MCNESANSCPDPAQDRYWVFYKDPGDASWSRQTDPETVCLGAGAPQLTPIQVVVQTVQREFKTFPLPVVSAATDPAPRTLIHIPTRFAAEGPAEHLIDTTIVGLGVHITCRVTSYDWSFGDGGTLVTSVPGSSGSDAVTHRYERKGEFATQVTVTWAGTFTVDGYPKTYTVDGTVTKVGPAGGVQVVTARSELVSR